jgi:peroxiredoxin Q/BCP
MSMPRKGELAPDFSLDADDGSRVTLGSLRGKYVVLWFYPKDATPG